MAKKEKPKENPFKSFFSEAASSILIKSLKGYAQTLMDSLHDAIDAIHDRLAKSIISLVMGILALIFISIGVILLINEYLHLSKGWTFFVVGLILLLWGMAIKSRLKRRK
ncbi:TPA: hypothetical protein HA361_06780 [Candidatus Woesearchaeota archaeon]|nr:hypothetical protein [Candidatus Woesearchaeota archaeon]